MTIEVDIAIIGAGVVGLAIAAELSGRGRSVFVFERNSSFGQETSSRNSEVIHAGIYYPQDSLKARFCVEGKRLLYDLCQKYSIPFKNTGKLVIASSDAETRKLDVIYEQARKNGVLDLVTLSQQDIKKFEPKVNGKAGLLSPSTGIIDSHSLMQFYHQYSWENGAEFLFESEIIGIERFNSGLKLQIRDWEGISEVTAKVVINSAGLESDKIAQLAGIDVEDSGYRLHYCKGDYFGLSSKWRNAVNRLVYPTPEEAGLGVHVTLALDGMIRLGPDANYIDDIDYHVDISKKDVFYKAAKRYLPDIELTDIHPDFSGIRPKLQGPGVEFRDFVIRHENQAGFPGLINLIGIESPGLTASPAIARHVGRLSAEILA